MNRHDFISKIISMYPHVIKGAGIETYYDLYKRSLSGLIVDYEELFNLFVSQYVGDFPPKGKEIRDMALHCSKAEVKNTGKVLSAVVYNPILKNVTTTDCFPIGTSTEQMLRYYKSHFPGFDGWKILNVYEIGG